MPIFILISKHTAESCPIHNEEMKKLGLEVTAKMGEMAKQLGIKVLGDYGVLPEHTEYLIVEGTYDAMQRIMADPLMIQWVSRTTTEMKVAVPEADLIKSMQ